MLALTDALFWLGLGIILPAGYAVAYSAMYWAMKQEQKKAYKLTSPIDNQNHKNIIIIIKMITDPTLLFQKSRRN